MPYTINENYRLKRLSKLSISCNKVLDIGCSQYPNIYLSNREVIGLDLKKGAMPENYTNFINGDVSEIAKINSSYDAVIAGEIIEHLEDPISFLRQCKSCLNENGKLILSTPNPHSFFESLLTLFLNRKFFYTKDHIMLFPQRWLIRMLEVAGFHDVKLYSGGFPVPFIGLVPCPRFFCHQTIAVAFSSKKENV